MSPRPSETALSLAPTSSPGTAIPAPTTSNRGAPKVVAEGVRLACRLSHVACRLSAQATQGPRRGRYRHPPGTRQATRQATSDKIRRCQAASRAGVRHASGPGVRARDTRSRLRVWVSGPCDGVRCHRGVKVAAPTPTAGPSEGRETPTGSGHQSPMTTTRPQVRGHSYAPDQGSKTGPPDPGQEVTPAPRSPRPGSPGRGLLRAPELPGGSDARHPAPVPCGACGEEREGGYG